MEKIQREFKIFNGLMQTYQRPFYFYSEKIIEQQVKKLVEKLPHFEFLYSVKTNPLSQILKFVASHNFGADAASSEEVMIAYRTGLPYDKILYSSPGKTRKDIEITLDKAIIIADSYHELTLLNEIAAQRNVAIKVGLRINPDYTMDKGGGESSKFGVDEESLQENSRFFSTLTNLVLVGIHVHLRSQVLDVDQLTEYYDKIFKLAVFCQETLGWSLEFINFGGGLGIVYSLINDKPLELNQLNVNCQNLIDRYGDRIKARLIIETGRYVICDAGQYVSRIVDIKTSRGVKYLIIENGLNGFMRPSVSELLVAYAPKGEKMRGSEPLFSAPDAFEFSLPGREGGRLERVHVVGNLCTAADVMVKNMLLPEAEIGDLFVVSKAGSYAYSLSPLLFGSHALPHQFYESVLGEVTLV